MKTIYSHVLFIILAILSSLSLNAVMHNSSIENIDSEIFSSLLQSDNNRHYRCKDNFSDYDIQVRGKIKVNDNDTGILSISPGGSLKISKKTFGNKRSVIIESNSLGILNYEYYEGRTKIDYKPEGEKWLADILLDVLRITGIDAEGRVKRFYKQDGVDAVLQEIEMISSNSVRALYFEALLDDYKLNEMEVMAISTGISKLSSNTARGELYSAYSSIFLINTNTSIVFFSNVSKLSSNSERARILVQISEKINFEDGEVIEAYFAVVDRMSSNTERGRVMRNLENTQDLTVSTYTRLLQSVGKLSSNTEMGTTLRSLDKMDLSNPAISEAFFNTVDKMSSNTEMGSTLRHYISEENLSKENYIRMLATIKKMSSNTEMGSVLRSFPKMDLTDSSLVVAYFLAIDGMSSNTEAGSVLETLLKNIK